MDYTSLSLQSESPENFFTSYAENPGISTTCTDSEEIFLMRHLVPIVKNTIRHITVNGSIPPIAEEYHEIDGMEEAQELEREIADILLQWLYIDSYA